MKFTTLTLAAATAALSFAGTAQAGSLTDPIVEPIVIIEAASSSSSSGLLVPLLFILLLVVALNPATSPGA